ncbi:ankyrin repeat domain-containing protein [Wolbachia endosymbiont (group A) of Barypeithes pellucidus]|uniref:ankyrin repeat domain-containing protein n=1 Tax=Wolbachia endosymbiont (group A) of Barypeithes pellucidus TaxID=3139322 RepID=UPI003CCAD8DE
MALYWAAQNGHEGVVKVLLTIEKVDVAAKGIHEKTLLHLAAEKGYTDIVNTLLRKGADVNAKDYFGNTPLHCAAANGHTEIVSALIRSEGINVYAKDNKNNAPLDLAKKIITTR